MREKREVGRVGEKEESKRRKGRHYTCGISKKSWLIFCFGVICSAQPEQGKASDSESFQTMCHLVFHFRGDLALSSVSMFFKHNLLFLSESFLRNVGWKATRSTFRDSMSKWCFSLLSPCTFLDRSCPLHLPLLISLPCILLVLFLFTPSPSGKAFLPELGDLWMSLWVSWSLLPTSTVPLPLSQQFFPFLLQ